VTRDGQGDSMGIAINIHKGGYRTTSSEGCQTIHPSQWPAFVALVYSEMDRVGQKTIPYLLMEEEV
jgi:lysozyme